MPATLILVDALPGATGWYAHYEHRRTGSQGWTFCDLRALVSECQERWMVQIEGWNHELSRAGAARTWNYWLLPASRLMAWYPVDLKPLLFSLAVVEQTRREPSGVLHLVSVPDDVALYLEEWRTQQVGSGDLVLIDARRSRAGLASVFGRARRAVAPFLDGLTRLRSVVTRALLRRTPGDIGGRADVLVMSHTLTLAAMEHGGDHFFGRMFDQERLKASGRVRWMYHLTQFSERNTVRAHCRSIGRETSFDFDWLRWIDVPVIVSDAIRLRHRLRGLHRAAPVLTIGGLRTSVFPRRFVAGAVSGYVPIMELATYRSVRRCLRAVQPATVVYPYEEKGIERAVLRACREHTSPVRTIAFAHAVFSSGHRYVRHLSGDGQPAPDRLATTGPAALRWMTEWAGWDPSRLLMVGSPRAPMRTVAPRTSRTGPLRVLLLVGFGTEVEQLANYAETQPDLFHGCELMVRRYPYAWHDAQDRGLQRLADLGVPCAVDQQGLEEQIAWADAILFSSTSAGIEAMLSGRVVIRVGLDDIFDADPIEDKGEAGAVVQCRTPAELKSALALVAEASAASYAALVEGQRRFAGRIYAPVDETALAHAVFAAD